MKYLAIIPARYASTRFPAKPLALLGGKPIIQHVYEHVAPHFDKTLVATDHASIQQCVESFGGQAVMTSPHHRSGTDRCCEALEKCTDGPYDVVVNVQGDEPFVHPAQLEAIKHCFVEEETQIATLVTPFRKNASWEVLQNPNSPKVVVDARGFALCFSRSVIPFIRGVEKAQWLSRHKFLKHIGLYAFKSSVLREITHLPQSSLEKAESLEQLRWLENGFRIKTIESSYETIGIDTPEDLQKAEIFMKSTSNN